MPEIINEVVHKIEQIIFWLEVSIYLVVGIFTVWLIGFVRRHLGLDINSIELRRIRRLLEERNSKK